MKQFLLLLLFIYPLCVFAQPNGRNSIETIIITDVQVKAIDSIVNAVYKADEPGASVLLAQNGKILLRKGYGMANMELRVPVYPDHVFAIASMSKYFTAVAILILQEQGKLNVKDDVHKYMPAYNTHGKTISIENLLTHTSGIPGDGEMQSYGVKAKLEESRYTGMQFSEDQPLLFEPGTNWSYSNPGFNLLAFIVEKASGQSFKEFVQQNILNKLGMNQTYFGRKGVIPLKTTGYAFNQQRNIYERIEEGSYVESKFL